MLAATTHETGLRVQLTRQNQLVINQPLRINLKQTATRVHMHRLAILHSPIRIPPSLQPRRIREEPRRNRLLDRHDVAFTAAANLHLHPLTQPAQLVPHVPRPPQTPELEEVLPRPYIAEVRVHPLVPDIQQREMVPAGFIREPLSRLVGVKLLILRPVEQTARLPQHRNDAQHLLDAPVPVCSEDALRQHRVRGELGHLPPDLRQLPLIVQRTQRVQVLQRADQRLGGGRVHKVKLDQVVDAQTLQEEHNRVQVGPLDLGRRVFVELVLVGPFGVESEALAGADAAGAPHALFGGGARAGGHDEGLHPGAGVVDVLLDEAGVDDVDDAVDREGGFGDVCGEDDLAGAGGGGLEDLCLELRGEVCVYGADDHFADLVAQLAAGLLQVLLGGVDLVLAGEEDEDVAVRGGGRVDLEDRGDGGVEVVGLGLLGVVDVDGVPAAGDVEDGRAVKVPRELLRVHRRGRDEQLELRPEARDVLDEAEEDVGREGALVGLVDHERGVPAEVGLGEELAEQHAVGHVLEDGLVGGRVLEADGVAHLVADLDAHLVGDARGDGHGGDAAGLRAADLEPAAGVAGLVEVLRELGGLAGAGLADDDEDLVPLDGVEEALAPLVYGEGPAGLVDAPGLALGGPQLGLDGLLLLAGEDAVFVEVGGIEHEPELLRVVEDVLVVAAAAAVAALRPADLRARLLRLVLLPLLLLGDEALLAVLAAVDVALVQRLLLLLHVDLALLGDVVVGQHVPVAVVVDAQPLLREPQDLLVLRELVLLARGEAGVGAELVLLLGDLLPEQRELLELALLEVLLAGAVAQGREGGGARGGESRGSRSASSSPQRSSSVSRRRMRFVRRALSAGGEAGSPPSGRRSRRSSLRASRRFSLLLFSRAAVTGGGIIAASSSSSMASRAYFFLRSGGGSFFSRGGLRATRA